MKKFMGLMEKYLMPLAMKMASNKHLNALKDGFVYTMPFLIIGSFVLLLVNLPFRDVNTPLYMKWYDDLMTAYKANLVQPFYVSMGIMSVFVAFGIGSSLATQYKLNGITGGFLSLFTFLLTAAKLEWAPIGGYKAADLLGNNDYLLNTFHQGSGWMPIMDARYLDAKGLFTAIVGAFISIEIFRLLVSKKMTIKLPDSVPPAIAKSFELLTPIVAVILVFHPISLLVQKSREIFIPELLLQMFRPLVSASDSLPAVIGILLIVHILWFAGLHGVNVVVAIINPIILTNLATNQAALQAGEKATKVLAGGFLDAFVYLGGAGATLGLAIAMFLSKKDHIKSIGKISLIPGLFNINEPIIFGAPIVMNPILFVPFIVTPIINATIAWFAVKSGLVGHIVSLVPWTTPSPIGALLATNFSMGALILSVLLIGLSVIIYYPFLKVYEASLDREEAMELEAVKAD